MVQLVRERAGQHRCVRGAVCAQEMPALLLKFALGRRQRVDTFDVLLLASAAFFAFRAKRDLWFLVLAARTTTNAHARGPSAARTSAGSHLGG